MTRNPVQFTNVTGGAAEVGSTANNYQILARLATGGMAEIFLARGTSTTGVERYVVLKRILRDRANDTQLVKMFLDEARLAAQLQHPNIAQVYDIGKLGDSYFFTMEYVHGETVRGLLHRARSLRREIPSNVILTVMAGAAAGLHHAHERLGHDGKPLGIVHRDVSPSNLMVSYEGSVKVVDFGVAKAENRAQETRSGTVKGKIAYLSPEQCKGGSLDRRSDLFSLGIVFWEMLTVERLYKRNSDFENMTAIVTEDPVPPSARRPGIAPDLDRIVLKLLAKDPDHRYQTADELVEALEEAAPRLGTMISTSSVGRLLRDMFGQRPEPWLEMDSTTVQMPNAEPHVTVTSEPVPRELVASPAASVDMMLANVRDLSHPIPAEVPSDPSGGIVRSQQLTAPAMPVSNATGEQRPISPASTVQGFVPPPPQYPGARTSQPMPPLPEHASGPIPQLPDSRPSGQIAPFPQLPHETFSPTGSSSGEHAYPNYGSGSQSGVNSYPSGSHAGYPVLQSGDLQQPQHAPSPSRRWPLLAIVAVAALLGSLTVWFVMRRGDRPAPDAAVVAIADAAVAVVDELPPSPPDAEVAVTPDTTPAIAPPDAAAVEPPADAATVVAPEDAAVAKVVPDAAAPPPDKDPLVVAFEDKRYADVVAECMRTFRPEQAPVCTLAACRSNQDVRAQKWHARIASAAAKRSVGNACRELGIDVTPRTVRPPPKPDAGVDPCAANPMACQR